jgi:hypothetical protein
MSNAYAIPVPVNIAVLKTTTIARFKITPLDMSFFPPMQKVSLVTTKSLIPEISRKKH